MRHPFPFSAGIVGAALFALFASAPARAASVVFDVSGSARAFANTLSPTDIDNTVPITTFPGSGSVEADEPISLVSAKTTWTLTETPDLARFDFALFGFGGRGGDATAEGKIKFKTLNPGRFKLLVRFLTDYGNTSFGDIDGQRETFSFNFMNPAPGGEKVLEGDLPAGEHEFTAFSGAGQTRSNPLRADGNVTLEVTPIPLPPALVPGAIVLGGVAIQTWRRRVMR